MTVHPEPQSLCYTLQSCWTPVNREPKPPLRSKPMLSPEPLAALLWLQLSDELAAQLKQMVEDRDRWQAKATAAEASAKKLSDTVAALERQVASQEANAEAERAQFTRTLAAREKEVRAARDQMAAMQESLGHARQTVLDALNAQSRQEVVEVVMGAVRALMPGASAYVAELKTVVGCCGVGWWEGRGLAGGECGILCLCLRWDLKASVR